MALRRRAPDSVKEDSAKESAEDVWRLADVHALVHKKGILNQKGILNHIY